MPLFEYYTDAAGEHRWRVRSPNGRIIGASTEGYATKGGAVRNAELLHRMFMTAWGYRWNPVRKGAK